jgi:hypothetical protein
VNSIFLLYHHLMMILNMDNVDENLLILLDLNVLNIFESHVVNVNHIILFSYHVNMMQDNYLMNGILLDELHHYVIDMFELVFLYLNPI